MTKPQQVRVTWADAEMVRAAIAKKRNSKQTSALSGFFFSLGLFPSVVVLSLVLIVVLVLSTAFLAVSFIHLLLFTIFPCADTSNLFLVATRLPLGFLWFYPSVAPFVLFRACLAAVLSFRTTVAVNYRRLFSL